MKYVLLMLLLCVGCQSVRTSAFIEKDFYIDNTMAPDMRTRIEVSMTHDI